MGRESQRAAWTDGGAMEHLTEIEKTQTLGEPLIVLGHGLPLARRPPRRTQILGGDGGSAGHGRRHRRVGRGRLRVCAAQHRGLIRRETSLKHRPEIRPAPRSAISLAKAPRRAAQCNADARMSQLMTGRRSLGCGRCGRGAGAGAAAAQRADAALERRRPQPLPLPPPS